MTQSKKIARRDFHGYLLTLSVAAGCNQTQSPAEGAESDDKPKQEQPASTDAADESPRVDDLSVDELLTEVVRRLYPDERLTAAVTDQIQSDITVQRYRGALFTRVPLTNGDAPAAIFRPLLSDDD